MTYRLVVLGTETFWVRIPDEAVAEWAEARERLTSQGHPDRPHDVDTPGARVWVRHPGEDHPYFEAQDNHRSEDYFAVLTMVWSAPGTQTRLYVTGFADGTFAADLRLGGDTGITRHKDYAVDLDPNEVWDDIEMAISLADHGYAWPEDQPLVNWLWDFEAIEAGIDEAKADVRATIPTGPVQ